jgi:hypothetical protein
MLPAPGMALALLCDIAAATCLFPRRPTRGVNLRTP